MVGTASLAPLWSAPLFIQALRRSLLSICGTDRMSSNLGYLKNLEMSGNLKVGPKGQGKSGNLKKAVKVREKSRFFLNIKFCRHLRIDEFQLNAD